MSAPLEIHMFPCLWDNYGFLIHNPETKETACIDTPEVDKIVLALEEKSWTLTHIWNTHHHPDHAGGNAELKRIYGVEVLGCGQDAARIPGIDRHLSDGDVFQFGGHDVHVFETFGHTIGHIIYYVPSAKAAFVGDTIFAMGCGRLFEGTPEQMYDSMRKIEALPDDTALYCAHEYTLSNAAFAVDAFPNNVAIAARKAEMEALRDRGEPTIPTTIEEELATNPFLLARDADHFGQLRVAKDKA